MKKVLAVVGMALGLALLAPVAPAHADETSYLYTLEQLGVEGSVSNELWWGYAVCQDARIGRTVQESTRNVFLYEGNGITYEQSAGVVAAALMYLC